MPVVNYDWDELEDNIVEEYDDAGATIADYTTEPDHFGNVISQHCSGQSSFFHYDGQGSTLGVTNESQTVTDTRAYTAFGETTESTGGTTFPFQYVGEKGYYFNPALGTCIARRRDYEIEQARWCASEPLDPPLLSYTYVSNSPTRYVDPSGLVIFDLSPSQVENAPWCAVGTNKITEDPDQFPGRPKPKPDPNGLATHVRADTKVVQFDMSCACKCIFSGTPQCPTRLYMAECLVTAYFQIRIARDHIFGDHTVRGSYGHEQLHLRNFLTIANVVGGAVAQVIETRIYTSMTVCRQATAGGVTVGNKYFGEAIAREESHGGGSDEFDPEAGKDYPPIDPMPKTPNCTMPGRPTKAVKEEDCE